MPARRELSSPPPPKAMSARTANASARRASVTQASAQAAAPRASAPRPPAIRSPSRRQRASARTASAPRASASSEIDVGNYDVRVAVGRQLGMSDEVIENMRRRGVHAPRSARERAPAATFLGRFGGVGLWVGTADAWESPEFIKTYHIKLGIDCRGDQPSRRASAFYAGSGQSLRSYSTYIRTLARTSGRASALVMASARPNT